MAWPSLSGCHHFKGEPANHFFLCQNQRTGNYFEIPNGWEGPKHSGREPLLSHCFPRHFSTGGEAGSWDSNQHSARGCSLNHCTTLPQAADSSAQNSLLESLMLTGGLPVPPKNRQRVRPQNSKEELPNTPISSALDEPGTFVRDRPARQPFSPLHGHGLTLVVFL